MKKILLAILSIAMVGVLGVAAVGCGEDKMTDTITVITRESGSGTRGAFIELTGVQQKDKDGNKVDRTVKTAQVANSTAVALQNVQKNPSAIAYISLGSLNDSVKAVPFEGTAATVDNIKNGSYTLSRPFNLAYKADNDNPTLKDFMKYIASTEAAAVIDGEDFIAPENTASYTKPATAPTEKLVVNGSSSVYPLMQVLVESYCKASGVSKSTIDLQFNDSTAGMTGAMNGTYDLGMASRELEESEAAALQSVVLATDGIAVIVNNMNPITNITKEQLCNIYIGVATKWSDVGVSVEA